MAGAVDLEVVDAIALDYRGAAADRYDAAPVPVRVGGTMRHDPWATAERGDEHGNLTGRADVQVGFDRSFTTAGCYHVEIAE